MTDCAGVTALGQPCAKQDGHQPPCSKFPLGVSLLELAAHMDYWSATELAEDKRRNEEK